MTWLWVGVGGFVGAVSRFGIVSLFKGTFPFGVLLANVGGCLLAGVMLGISHKVPQPVLSAVSIGFLGALTTFSAFSVDTIKLFETRASFALINIVLSVLICLAAVLAGRKIALLLF